MPKIGLLISQDLFFTSKVTGTAAALGMQVRTAATMDQVRSLIGQEDVGLVILDLDCRGISPGDVLASLAAGAAVSTVAFGPHVRADQLDEARQAGFQQVLPRSRFSSGLAELLQSTLGSGRSV